jgi:hypothetical protein
MSSRMVLSLLGQRLYEEQASIGILGLVKEIWVRRWDEVLTGYGSVMHG